MLSSLQIENVAVIQKADVHFEKGLNVLTGETGAGKTTIQNLICRYYDIQKGSITIDGIDVKNIKLEDLRRNIGQMLQDVFLFTGDVKDNIRLNEKNITDEDIIAAAKKENAYETSVKKNQIEDKYAKAVSALEGDKKSAKENLAESYANLEKLYSQLRENSLNDSIKRGMARSPFRMLVVPFLFRLFLSPFEQGSPRFCFLFQARTCRFFLSRRCCISRIP